MNKAEPTDEYEFHCSTCHAVIDEHDKYCRQCGGDTSETIDEPAEAKISAQLDNTDVPSSTEASVPILESSASKPIGKSRVGLRAAAILLFVMAVFQFANQVLNSHGQVSGTSSSLPVLVNVVIGIGLLRPQGFWNTSQNGYRIWAIFRCLAVPILIAIGIIEPTLNVTGAFIIHSPDLLIAGGLLTILLGPPPSPKRVALGVTLSVIGFIGIAILIGLAST
jgi:hypothetical protein